MYCTAHSFRRFSTAMTAVARRVENIIKPSCDQRKYRGVVLKNGLKALLVSDPTTDKSAASLDVAVGHLNDPWELPGLAHFCEHMLFMGTEKYPVENEYAKYISSNAGYTNAFTASDHTCYYFDIKPDAFAGGLDRFVQFFLTPQFDPSSTEREVLAVDSEHSKNLKSDPWRTLQIERFLSKPGHDMGKFGTGDKFTLMEGAIAKGLDTRKELLKFHQEWYSSNIMSCILLGKESLDELENYLLTLGFDKIPNKNVDMMYWKEHCYGTEELKKKVTVVPVKEMRLLKMHFKIPYMNHEYKADPLHYLSHLLGHEGRGSLLSELKKKGWVTTLSASGTTKSRGIATLCVSMMLGEEGLKKTDDIVELVFQYIALLKKEGTQKWIFEELKKISDIDFNFQDKIRPDNFVRSHTATMHEAQIEDVLSCKKILTEYRPDLIESVLNSLTPENLLYLVFDKSIAGQDRTEIEPIYGSEFYIEKLSQDLLNRYQKALTTLNPAFKLPEKNLYIPTDFSLKAEKSKSDGPVVISDSPWIRVWHKKDEEYLLPKAVTTVRIHSPAIRRCPRSAALMMLLSYLYEDSLTEEIYNPNLAGLYNSLELGISAFNIGVSGYNEKQAILMKFLLQHLIDFIPDPNRFEILLKELQRVLRNAEYRMPTSISQEWLRRFLWNNKWTDEQKLAQLLNLTIDDVLEFRKELFSAFHIEMLSYGNVSEQESVELANSVVDILTSSGKSRPLYANEYWLNREVELPTGKELVYRHWKNTHEVSCVEIWYQIGVMNTETHAMNNLLTHIMHEPAFDQLRTKETLGYVVHSTTKTSHGTSAIRIIVQGNHKPDFVRSRIFAFLDSFRAFLHNMSDEEFIQQRDATICELLVQPKTMDGRNTRYFDQINENQAEFLRNVTKKDLTDFFDRKLAKDGEERKTLTIFVHSSKDSQDTVKTGTNGFEEVESPYVVRSTFGLYPRAKPAMNLPPVGISPFEVKSPIDKAHI